MNKKILCLGCVTADIIVTPADTIPTPGTLRAVDSVSTHVGGCASNASINLAKMGVPVGLSCKVGNDNFGDFIKKTITESGADISGVITDDNVSTTVSIVCVSLTGERSFFYNPGTTSAYSKNDITEELIQKYDIIFVAGALLLTAFDGEPCAEVLKYAKSIGKYTAMDTAYDFEDIWMPKIEQCLPYLDLFMPSYIEAAKLSGETEVEKMADLFIKKGVKNVVIKMGDKGAYFREEDKEGYILPTYTKINVVDTTGAGDAFCSGFLCGVSRGWSFYESGRFANAVGTHCIMKIGATTGIKSIDEMKKFMEENEL